MLMGAMAPAQWPASCYAWGLTLIYACPMAAFLALLSKTSVTRTPLCERGAWAPGSDDTAPLRFFYDPLSTQDRPLWADATAMSTEVPATFDAFGLRAEVLDALKRLGYEEPTPIQLATIPALMAGKDVLGQAATGTGKTAAFALPLLERVKPAERRVGQTQALVLVPTRELAMQVAEAIQKYGAGIGVSALAVYGGQAIVGQIKALKRGVDVVIATPGRALDHLRRKTLGLSQVKLVVLDEADEMLDMGFEEDLQTLLDALPPSRQTALFSATLPARIARIAETHLNDPVRVTIAAKALEAGAQPSIRQAAFVVPRRLKEAALMRVLEWESPQSTIIFCRTRNEVETLTETLMRAGYAPAALHGGLSQEQRDGVLGRFKKGTVRVLVATDVAARGLHVEGLSHVVNYDLPTSPEAYVHRIGRTGRAGKKGVALSLLDAREMRLLSNIERQIKKKVALEQVPGRAQLDARRQAAVVQRVQQEMEAPTQSERWVALVDKMSAQASVADMAAAAMALLQQQLFPPHESDTAEFPTAGARDKPSKAGAQDSARGPGRSPGRYADRFDRPEPASAGRARTRQEPARDDAPRSRGGKPAQAMTALSLSVGSRAGVRAQDLVGAIANEAGVPSRDIHGVRIDEFRSRVEVPAWAARQVMTALRATTVRGQAVRVSVERGAADEGEDRPHRPMKAAGKDKAAGHSAAGKKVGRRRE